MPTGNEVEVTFKLADGTELCRVEALADITTFLEQHKEYVKVVRCRDCANWDDGKTVYKNNTVWSKYCTANMMMTTPDFYCAWNERKEQTE